MWDPIIKGCTTSTACNYNPEAKEDDNSCIAPIGCNNWCPDDTIGVQELDCAGICGGINFIDCTGQCGILVIDECGVCGGNNTICKDCNEVVNGTAYKDNCSICVGGDTGLEACNYDCTGYWGGDAELDECDICNGDNSTCKDCNGVINGTASIDGCGDCVGGDTGVEECDYDCAGTLGGELIIDQCGVCNGDNSTCKDCNEVVNGTASIDGCGDCVGGNTTLDACPTDCAGVDGGKSFYDNCDACVPYGDVSCVQGCDGIWENTGLQKVYDYCNICGGDNSICTDCNSVVNGSAYIDPNCGSGESCVYGNTGLTACILDCAGEWGGDTELDECEICGGDNSICAGCDGIPNSGLKIDVCGVCGGDGTCLPENCTDDNESGYCQDLSVLQILIDNSSETLNMNMDVNGNGVIEPLELGAQGWSDGRLTILNCWNEGLSGEIPPEIGNLTSLAYLSLWINELTGEIPSEIGNLTSLYLLDLKTNQLTGEIPPEIGNLINLAGLRLGDNKLTGEIPEEICNLTSLINSATSPMDLESNQLCPPYPSCIEDYVGEQNISDCLLEDIDGNTYETVEIGNQIWMAENLKTTHYNNGDAIPTGHSNFDWSNLTTGAYAVYDDDPANADIYGNLYNWYTVDDSRGVCPDGFHVPSDEEWTILTNSLGGTSVAAGKMKEAGLDHWDSPNTGATNESGFTGLPAGDRIGSTGSYYNMGILGYFWSSSEYSSSNVWYRLLTYDYSNVYRYDYTKHGGFSIRCVAN